MIHTLWQHFRFWTNGVVLIGLLLIATQCSPTAKPIAQETPPRDRPEITGFTLSPSGPVCPGARIRIQVNVNRNDNKIDNYRWVVRPGEGSIISGQGTSLITYEAPKTPGHCEVRVELEYAGGLPVEDSTTVEVVPETTPTPTDTPSPILIDTPSPNTPTPTPTVTPTPIPIPYARVTVEALNLRAGPGTEYRIIRTLKGGETLTVLGRTPNGDWLHVRTPRLEEGWVNASCVDLVGNLALVPTVFAPTPLWPLTEDGICFVNEVKFEWTWIRPLAESEYFSIRVSRQDTGEECFHDKTQNNTIYLGSLVSCNPGKLFWKTVAVRLVSKDPEEWLELSRLSEPQVFDFERK